MSRTRDVLTAHFNNWLLTLVLDDRAAARRREELAPVDEAEPDEPVERATGHASKAESIPDPIPDPDLRYTFATSFFWYMNGNLQGRLLLRIHPRCCRWKNERVTKDLTIWHGAWFWEGDDLHVAFDCKGRKELANFKWALVGPDSKGVDYAARHIRIEWDANFKVDRTTGRLAGMISSCETSASV